MRRKVFQITNATGLRLPAPLHQRMQLLLRLQTTATPQLLQLITLLINLPQHRIALQSNFQVLLLLRLDQSHLTGQQPLQTAITRTNLLIHHRLLLTQHRLHHPLTILTHNIEPAVGNGLNRLDIHFLLTRYIMCDRLEALGICQPEELEQTNIAPANIHFIPAARQLGGIGVGVVIIVQLFAANQDAPGRNIAGIIAAFEIAIPHKVPDAIDHTGSPDRNPHHLHRPDPDTVNTEQQQINHRHQLNAQQFIAAIHVVLDPVFRGTLAITLQSFWRTGLVVQFGTFKQHLADTQDHRAVRVFLSFALGVMFTVNRRPLLGVLGRGQPQPEAEKMRQHRMKIQRVVGRMTMQVKRNADNCDVGKPQRNQNQLHHRKVQKTVVPHRVFLVRNPGPALPDKPY